MQIIYDHDKRNLTLADRGLDMADAAQMFDGLSLTYPDIRKNYGEKRQITVGFLSGRMVVVVWVQRGDARRIISMRKANEREQAQYAPWFRGETGSVP